MFLCATARPRHCTKTNSLWDGEIVTWSHPSHSRQVAKRAMEQPQFVCAGPARWTQHMALDVHDVSNVIGAHVIAKHPNLALQVLNLS